MAKLVKVYDANEEKDILINIDNISLITDNYIYLNNNSKLHSIINTNRESIVRVYEACGYYEPPHRQIEAATIGEGEWGRFDDVRIWSSPRKYTQEEALDPSLIIGSCECCVAQPYGHVFKKADHPNGEVNYKCVFCGAECGLMFNPINNKNS